MVQLGGFAHRVPPRVVKWMARVRCGCLATRDRLARHGFAGVTSPASLCCGASCEDDAHVLMGCAATGSAPVLPLLQEAWLAASLATEVPVPSPPASWLLEHAASLMAALIPLDALAHSPLQAVDSVRFLPALHIALAERAAEVLRRRGELMATAPVAPLVEVVPPTGDSLTLAAVMAAELSSSTGGPGLRRPPALPPDLRLSVAELRALEVQRRAAGTPAPPVTAPPRAPPCGSPRRCWLSARLVRMLQEDTVLCPAAQGCKPQVLLDLFEELTGEPYTRVPGSSATSRLTGFSKALANLVGSDMLSPPLQRHGVAGGRWLYNRTPRVHRDDGRWRQRVEREAAACPAPPPTVTLADVNAGLAPWLKYHPHLRAAPVEQGLPSMALMMLWEVDKGMPFPSAAAGSESSLVVGFTRRLRRCVDQDSELRSCMQPKDIVGALCPGLRDSHNVRWPVQLVPPVAGEPAAWYESFTRRWKDY